MGKSYKNYPFNWFSVYLSHPFSMYSIVHLYAYMCTYMHVYEHERSSRNLACEDNKESGAISDIKLPF